MVLVFPQRVSVLTRTAAIRASRSPAKTSSTRSSAAARATSSIRRTPRPRLWRSSATFRIVGPPANACCPRPSSSLCRSRIPARENVLALDEALAEIQLPAPRTGTRSTYHKIMDREAWTHAVVSAAIVLEMDKDVCRRARIVLGGVAPIPWRLPEVEQMLAGQRITERWRRRPPKPL